MSSTFWLDKTYKEELLKDAKKLILSGKRRGLSLLKDYFSNRIFPRHITKHETIFRKFCDKSVNTILEIGSYDGYDSLIMSRLFPTSKIYSFEADIGNIPKVNKNIFFRNNIELIPKAASDKNGTIQFYQSQGKDNKNDFRGSGSILKPSEKHEKYWHELEFKNPVNVETVTIEEFAEQKNIKDLDIIWMDVQGAELHVLKGMGELIKTTKLVMLEIWEDDSFYKNSTTFNSLQKYFSDKNFILTNYWRDGVSGDAVFQNKNFL